MVWGAYPPSHFSYLAGVAGRLLIQSLITRAARASTSLCATGGIFTVGAALMSR